jgi:hypothetical protein
LWNCSKQCSIKVRWEWNCSKQCLKSDVASFLVIVRDEEVLTFQLVADS